MPPLSASKKYRLYASTETSIEARQITRCHNSKYHSINPLTPNDTYRGRTAPLTSKNCILYIYSTNIDTGYFKHGIYTVRFFLNSKCSLFHNSNVFGSSIIHIDVDVHFSVNHVQ